MKTVKKILLALLVVLVIIQFIHPAKNQSSGDQPNDIFNHYAASDTVKQLIKTVCYDCHSNNTNYPWYSKIQPVDWWLNHHITEGKRELNFSEFASYTAKKANHKLDKVGDEVDEKGMPLESYTLIHDNARLTDAERKSIVSWAQATSKQIVVPK